MKASGSKAKFVFSAILTHSIFILSFILFNFVKARAFDGWSGFVMHGCYGIMFLAASILFYFNPALFFISPSLRKKINTRTDNGREVGFVVFVLLKLFSWIVILFFPVIFFLWYGYFIGVVKGYLIFCYLYFFFFFGGFLFCGYERYRELKLENKWGVLSVY